jgi:hypothetical protein
MFRRGPVLVVRQAFDDDRNLMGSEPFVDDGLELRAVVESARTFLDGAFQGIARHRSALRLLYGHAQA